MAVKKYHLRRQEKAIIKKSELLRIIREQKLVTFAMCKNNEPYLVTVNHGFDRRKNCLYFHCATKGKKMDSLGQKMKLISCSRIAKAWKIFR